MIYGAIVCFRHALQLVGQTILSRRHLGRSIGGGPVLSLALRRGGGGHPKENGAGPPPSIIVLWNALILHLRWGVMISRAAGRGEL